MKEENKTKKLILLLIGVIAVLLGVIAYLFVLKPTLNGYTIKAQNDGVQYAVLTIMQQAAQCKQVPLTFGNQTINLIAVECLQAAAQQQAGTQTTPAK